MSIDTEQGAVTKIKNILRRSDSIVPYIEENDKTPVWDGNLFIYKQLQKSENNYKNENLLGKIPIQVKGKSVSNINNKTTKYSFSVDDLKSYYNDGGAILFVVEIIRNREQNIFKEKAFYTTLLPYDLKEKLKNIKEGQKTLTIKLRYLNPQEIDMFELECKNFISNKEKQFSTKNVELSPEEANEKYVTFIANKENFNKYIFNYKHYVYGKKEDSWPLSVTIDKVKFSTIKGKIDENVLINDTIYFNNYVLEQKKNSVKIIFENNLSFTIKGTNLKFDYKPHDNFYKRLNCLKFINHMLENKGFEVHDKFIEINSNEVNISDYKELEKEYEALQEVATLLDYFKIDYDKLNIATISEEGKRNLKILIDKIIYDKDVSVNFDHIPGLYKFKIGNITLLSFVVEYNDKIKIKNFENIKDKLIIKNENKVVENISPYILLSFNDILKSDNINPLALKESIINSNFDEIYSKNLVDLILKLIKVYDEINDNDYLNVALEITKWIKNKEPNNPVHIINEYQIYKRTRKLNVMEKNRLKKLIKNNIDYCKYNELLCCTYILLEDLNKFEKYFNKLNSSQKNKFKNYPIYTLCKKRDN